LRHEFSEDLVLAGGSIDEFGVLGDIVGLGNVVELNGTVAVLIELGKGKHDHIGSTLVHLSTDSGKEFVVGNSTVVVFVEVFENAFKFGRAEFVAVFKEAPPELGTVKLLVAVIVHASEDEGESTDTVSTSGVEGGSDLLEDLVWWLTLGTEGGVNVRVVTGSTDGEHAAEFFVVESSVRVLIK
jgi:hypothetical protein